VRENPEIEKERERERKNPPHTRKKKQTNQTYKIKNMNNNSKKLWQAIRTPELVARICGCPCLFFKFLFYFSLIISLFFSIIIIIGSLLTTMDGFFLSFSPPGLLMWDVLLFFYM
jgi:hypothetical protein